MKHKFIARILSVFILVSFSLFAFSSARAATTMTVTTTNDVIAEDGQCSLREAVIAANTDAPQGDCPAGSGPDTITFASSLPQPVTIRLTLSGTEEDAAATGDLDIIGQLTIIGLGQAQTILDGNGTDRVFDVRQGGNLTLSGLTLQNGNAINGGCISSVGRLNLNAVSVLSNHGDGLFNNGGLTTLTNVNVKDNLGGYGILNQSQGVLTFTGGEVSGNQNGGIYNTVATATLSDLKVLSNTGAGGVANVGSATSRLSMTGCVVANNTSSTNGGGIKNDGSQNIVDIHDTTVSDNQATSAGGGIFNIGIMSIAGSTIDSNRSRTGAGIDNFGGTLSLMNDTLSGNTATDNGGGLYNRGSATLINVTFADNQANGFETGGNIFNDTASLTVKNSIVTGSEADGNCFNSDGFIISQGHNLDSANTCKFTTASDLTDTNPMLGVLKDNGGATFTLALQSGSPAIDQGDNNGCPKTDQRNYSRPTDGDANGSEICDIGAYEVDGVPPIVTVPVTATESTPPTETLTPTSTYTQSHGTTDTPTTTPTGNSPTPTPTPNPIPPCSSAAIVLVLVSFLMLKRYH